MAQTARVFVGEKLNGKNYFSWSQSIKIILGHHKFGFLIEERPCPPPSYPQECYGKREDFLIRATLINNMEPQIGKPLLYTATAKDIWDNSKTGFERMSLCSTHCTNKFMNASKGQWM